LAGPPPPSPPAEARRDLANAELDPAALLRQALIELEEEWPELKKFGEQFKS
jgi:hypothetical protein